MDTPFCSRAEKLMSAEDPVALLTNAHTALLGQLRLLEQQKATEEEMAALLKALLRDSTLYFRREALLFKALSPKLNNQNQALQSLEEEQHALKREARDILQVLIDINGHQIGGWSKVIGPRLLGLTKQFRGHIRHVENVVGVLTKSRLTIDQQRNVALEMLAV